MNLSFLYLPSTSETEKQAGNEAVPLSWQVSYGNKLTETLDKLGRTDLVHQ